MAHSMRWLQAVTARKKTHSQQADMDTHFAQRMWRINAEKSAINSPPKSDGFLAPKLIAAGDDDAGDDAGEASSSSLFDGDALGAGFLKPPNEIPLPPPPAAPAPPLLLLERKPGLLVAVAPKDTAGLLSLALPPDPLALPNAGLLAPALPKAGLSPLVALPKAGLSPLPLPKAGLLAPALPKAGLLVPALPKAGLSPLALAPNVSLPPPALAPKAGLSPLEPPNAGLLPLALPKAGFPVNAPGMGVPKLGLSATLPGVGEPSYGGHVRVKGTRVRKES